MAPNDSVRIRINLRCLNSGKILHRLSAHLLHKGHRITHGNDVYLFESERSVVFHFRNESVWLALTQGLASVEDSLRDGVIIGSLSLTVSTKDLKLVLRLVHSLCDEIAGIGVLGN